MAKAGIHPVYHDNVEVICICGVVHLIRSAVAGPIKVETCKACHNAYTGKTEIKLSKGRAEKFQEKIRKMEAAKVRAAA
jgi:large subunit ribosomal protein L31